jgi:hypothetical protein
MTATLGDGLARHALPFIGEGFPTLLPSTYSALGRDHATWTARFGPRGDRVVDHHRLRPAFTEGGEPGPANEQVPNQEQQTYAYVYFTWSKATKRNVRRA